MRNRGSTVSAIVFEYRLDTVKSTMGLMSFKGIVHLVDQIVNEEEFKLYRWIVHCDWQIICDIVTESPDSRIIVRADPFPNKVWKTIYEHFCTSFFCVSKKQFFSITLRKTILRCAKTS